MSDVDPPALRALFGPGSDDAGIAPFARALARVLAHRHRALGGDAADAPAVEAAAYEACLAEDAGHACLAPERTVAWRDALARSPVVADAVRADRALILDAHGRVYLQRWFAYERALARAWCARAVAAPLFDDAAHACAVLDRLFEPAPPGANPAPIDWQRAAVALALVRRACVLSGGPGTGKTTTVARLIHAVLALDPHATVALAAPTGKAAARLAASMRTHLAQHAAPDALRARWPHDAVTVHALLEIGAHDARPRRHRARPLAATMVVVDEASMLGLSLATKLFDALGPAARVVLLGDKDQLASVETGIVFAQLSRERAFDAPTRAHLAALGAPIDAVGGPTAPTLPATRNSVVWLDRNYRFDAGSGIGRVARAIRDGDAEAALQALREGAPDIAWITSDDDLVAHVLARYEDYVRAVEDHAPAQALLARFDRHRALCALRAGTHDAHSAAGLNAQIERRLKARWQVPAHVEWYAGRAVLIERNDAALGVFNGDVGVTVRDADGTLRVAFAAAEGAVRHVHPARLPAHAGAFALTVHKAQGSEMQSVDVVLPTRDLPIATRELVYTAITRARSSVRIFGSADVLRAAIGRSVMRASGLDARLAEADHEAHDANPPGR